MDARRVQEGKRNGAKTILRVGLVALPRDAHPKPVGPDPASPFLDEGGGSREIGHLTRDRFEAGAENTGQAEKRDLPIEALAAADHLRHLDARKAPCDEGRERFADDQAKLHIGKPGRFQETDELNSVAIALLGIDEHLAAAEVLALPGRRHLIEPAPLEVALAGSAFPLGPAALEIAAVEQQAGVIVAGARIVGPLLEKTREGRLGLVEAAGLTQKDRPPPVDGDGRSAERLGPIELVQRRFETAQIAKGERESEVRRMRIGRQADGLPGRSEGVREPPDLPERTAADDVAAGVLRVAHEKLIGDRERVGITVQRLEQAGLDRQRLDACGIDRQRRLDRGERILLAGEPLQGDRPRDQRFLVVGPLTDGRVEVVQGLDRPILGEELVTAVQMGFGEAGLQADRLAIGGDRLVAPAHVAERIAEIEMGKRIVAPQFYGALIGGTRVLAAAKILKDDAAVAVRLGKARRDPDRLVERAERLALLALLQIDAAQQVAGDRMGEHRVAAAPKNADGFIGGAFREMIDRRSEDAVGVRID